MLSTMPKRQSLLKQFYSFKWTLYIFISIFVFTYKITFNRKKENAYNSNLASSKINLVFRGFPNNKIMLPIQHSDRLFRIVVSTCDWHPKGPWFDSRLYPRNFSESIGSGTESTQPREDNCVVT